MKSFITKHQSLLGWLLVILLTMPTFWSLIRPGFFFMQDDLQAFRIHQMDQCFQDFQFPCRWVPDAGYQYGYPQFLFYPPSVYYIGELIHLIGFQFIDSVKILFGLGYLLSALAMYLLLRNWLGRWPAVVGAVMYTYVPYKAVEVYVRGAMSEFWSFVLFPLIFWSTRRLILSGRWRDAGLVGLTVGLLLMTHNLMSLIFLPPLVIWVLSWIWAEKKWRVLPKVIVGGVLGVGLAGFFTFPVILEGKYVHLESLIGGYFDYRQHFVDLNQLFFNNHWGYGSSELGPGDDLSLTTGIVQWILALVGLVLAIINFGRHRAISAMTFGLAMTVLGTLFMIHQQSSFVWAQFPFLAFVQFPWRLLSVSVFLLAILDAMAIYFLQQRYPRWVAYGVGLLAIVVTVVMTATFFQPKEWYQISDQDKFSGKSWEKQLTISIFDYTPIYAKLPPPSQAPPQPEILDGQAQVLEYVKGSNWQWGRIAVIESATVRLPLFDFPGMVVKVDDQEVRHWHDDCRNQMYCLGLITFQLPPGEHIVAVKLEDTTVRLISSWVSVVSVMALVGLIVWRRR